MGLLNVTLAVFLKIMFFPSHLAVELSHLVEWLGIPLATTVESSAEPAALIGAGVCALAGLFAGPVGITVAAAWC